MPFLVNAKQCETCIFGPKTPVSPERFQELKRAWLKDNIVQVCHQATVVRQQIGCRGHYEAARRGDLPRHPIQNIWDALFVNAQSSLSLADLMQVSERLGFVQFVEVQGK